MAARSVESFVFRCPRSGRPSDDQRADEMGADTPRVYVPRDRAHGTCFLETLKWIGAPHEKVRGLFDGRARLLQSLTLNVPFVASYLAAPEINPGLYAFFEEVTKGRIVEEDLCLPRNHQLFQRRMNNFLPMIDPHSYDSVLLQAFQTYLKDDSAPENMALYLAEYKNRCLLKINTLFLNRFDTTPQVEFERIELRGRDGARIEDFESLPLGSRVRLTDLFVRIVTVEQFGVTPSSWNPRAEGHEATFEGLVEALQQGGPIAVHGRFGSEYYTKPPKQLMCRLQLQYPVSFWTKGAYKPKAPGDSTHVVLLVGAEQVGSKKMVYFIDPNDPSSPDQGVPPIYIMSYDAVCERMIPLCQGRVSAMAIQAGAEFQLDLVEGVATDG